MSKAVKPASFEDFLGASNRLSKREFAHAADAKSDVSSAGDASGDASCAGDISAKAAPSCAAKPSSVPGAKRAGGSFRKVKVGLTIDEGLVDAVDDYIYHARKQGRRLKKNDVYEAALRQFFEAEGVDVR